MGLWKHGIFACGCVISLMASANAQPGPGSGDAQLEARFKNYLEAWFQDEPLSATRLGDHRHDARLDDLTPAARHARLARYKQTLADLEAQVDPRLLSDDGRVDFQVFRDALTRSIWLTETFDPFRDDPRVWVEYATESVYLLFSQSTLPRETNLKNALARMESIPEILELARQTVGRPPRIKTETAIKQAKGAVDFYRNVLFTMAGEPRESSALAEKAAPVAAALERFVQYLETEVLPRSDGDWRIGREKFDKKLELELNAGLSAEEVLAEALSEADRVEREMAYVARYLWAAIYPGAAIPPDDPEGRRELIRRALKKIGDDHGEPERLVDDARQSVEQI
jgi:uncharacterized protein (DUF885 family)